MPNLMGSSAVTGFSASRMRMYPIANPKLTPWPISICALGPEKGAMPTDTSAQVLPPVPKRKSVQSPDCLEVMVKLEERVLLPMEVTPMVKRPKGFAELVLTVPVPCP